MTRPLSGWEVYQEVRERFPQGVALADGACLWVIPSHLSEVARFLKEAPGLELDYLNNLTAVDYLECIEVVYHLSSMKHNHSLTVRVQCRQRDNAQVPSVVHLWQGADLQEREVYDLMGVRFEGHPNLKRLLFWEGFEGHALRKDFIR